MSRSWVQLLLLLQVIIVAVNVGILAAIIHRRRRRQEIGWQLPGATVALAACSVSIATVATVTS